MYHYTHYTEDAARGGALWRDTAVIREELTELRRELAEAQTHLKECEERKEELVLLLTADTTPELCEALAEIVGECEEERDSVRAILERVEALADELRETLWWLRRTSA